MVRSQAAAPQVEGGGRITLAEALPVRRKDKQSLRSVIAAACEPAGLDLHAFNWDVAPVSKDDGDLLRGVDRSAFATLWWPGGRSQWLSEHAYHQELVGTPKQAPPAAPTEEPSYELLKCPPPKGNASAKAWKDWKSEHCIFTSAESCQAYWAAIRWRCPARLPVKLVGLWHSHTAELSADEPLLAAVEAFCKAAPPEALPLTPGDIVVQDMDKETDFIDQQSDSVREHFRGVTEDGPITFRAVLRDEARAQAERFAKLGGRPAGFYGFRGSKYLVDYTEASWLVSNEHGVKFFNRVGMEVRLRPAHHPTL